MTRMDNNNAKNERLKFLCRVVKKEIHHLSYSAEKVFNKRFNEEREKQLESDQALAEQVEAFRSRYCRLQDTIGDKLLPAWLNVLGEKTNVAIDNLDKAERMGVLPSVEQWLKLKQLRNQMIHEYIEDLTILANALQMAYKNLGFIIDALESIITDLENRGLIKGIDMEQPRNLAKSVTVE